MGYIGGGKVMGIAKYGIDSKYEFSLRKLGGYEESKGSIFLL